MKENVFVPLLTGNLEDWKGLPDDTTVSQLQEFLGFPQKQTSEYLGYYPADRMEYVADYPLGGIIAYSRDGKVILIETMLPPSISVMGTLPAPCGVLPHQILLPDAYAHEYIFCAKGLELTIASYFQKDIADKLIRCRGFRPISSVDHFGPGYYKAFEDETLWPDISS